MFPCRLDLGSNLTVHVNVHVNAKTVHYHASVDVQVTMDFKLHCIDRELAKQNMNHRFFLST